MSEDLMDFNNEDDYHVEETYTVRCSHCERDVVHASDTGEPVLGESCGDVNCQLLSSARDGGDPQILDFNDSGC